MRLVQYQDTMIPVTTPAKEPKAPEAALKINPLANPSHSFDFAMSLDWYGPV